MNKIIFFFFLILAFVSASSLKIPNLKDEKLYFSFPVGGGVPAPAPIVAPVTPAPVTPAPVTPAPVTPAPSPVGAPAAMCLKCSPATSFPSICPFPSAAPAVDVRHIGSDLGVYGNYCIFACMQFCNPTLTLRFCLTDGAATATLPVNDMCPPP